MHAQVSFRFHDLLEAREERRLVLALEVDRLSGDPRLTKRANRSRRARFDGKCDFCGKSGPCRVRATILPSEEEARFCCARCLAAFENDEDEPVDECSYCTGESTSVRAR
jgi:hypothetical protein